MWCKTPLHNTLAGPKNYALEELTALLSRLRPLLNEQWPGRGPSITIQTLPLPNNLLQVCLKVTGVDEEDSPAATAGTDPFSAIVSVKPPNPILEQWVDVLLKTLPGYTIAYSVDPKGEPALGVPTWFQEKVLLMQRDQGDTGVQRDPCGGRCLHWFVPNARYDPELGQRILYKMVTLWQQAGSPTHP
jgi:hypothetical protein